MSINSKLCIIRKVNDLIFHVCFWIIMLSFWYNGIFQERPLQWATPQQWLLIQVHISKWKEWCVCPSKTMMILSSLHITCQSYLPDKQISSHIMFILLVGIFNYLKEKYLWSYLLDNKSKENQKFEFHGLEYRKISLFGNNFC